MSSWSLFRSPVAQGRNSRVLLRRLCSSKGTPSSQSRRENSWAARSQHAWDQLGLDVGPNQGARDIQGFPVIQRERSGLDAPRWNAQQVDTTVQLTAKDILAQKPNTVHFISEDCTMSECAAEMWRLRVGTVLVKENAFQQIRGIISERDFMRMLTEAQGKNVNLTQVAVKDYMTPVSKLISVDPSDGIGTCMDKMRSYGIRHLPVIPLDAKDGDYTEVLQAKVEIARNHCIQLDQHLFKLEEGLCERYGEDAGTDLSEEVRQAPKLYVKDPRVEVRRVANVAVRVDDCYSLHQNAVSRLERWRSKQAQRIDTGPARDARHVVGVISLKDLLLSVTKQVILPDMPPGRPVGDD